jgi:hypothetical protein
MKMKQPVHKTDGLCGVECNPPAKGGPSLGSVMKQHGSNTPPNRGAKYPPQKPKIPMGPYAPGVKSEQSQ